MTPPVSILELNRHTGLLEKPSSFEERILERFLLSGFFVPCMYAAVVGPRGVEKDL